MLLEIDDVQASIEGVTILRDVDIGVNDAESVAIVGRNGAGKTSTFRTIMGLRKITNGSIQFCGEDITNYETHRRKRLGIGFAPEDRRLISKLTARENIEMSIWGSDDGDEIDVEERISLALDVFPVMEEFFDRAAGKLSGGQQQMVAVSRAIVSQPKLILLDEPFEGLAPSIKKDLREGIETIREDLGASVFIAESQLSHIKDIADRLYVIERGEIIAQTDEPRAIEEDEEMMQIIGGG